MKTNIVKNINTAVRRMQFKGNKYSPEILVVAGAVGAVTSAVLACKATLKLEDIKETHQENVEAVKEAAEHPEILSQPYSEEDQKHDLTVIHTKTALAITKAYAPAVILGGLSLTAMIGSNHILRKRNAALAAAYAAVDGAFKKYRSNVVERFGEQIDKEMRYSVKTEEVEDENGKKKKVQVVHADPHNDWTKIFDEASPYWENDAEYNLMFLRNKQSYFNDLLKVKKYIFLNDVLKALGIDETKEGQVIGWIYDPENPNGANMIDFGMYDMSDDRKRAFINGYEPNVWLDFNCDGNIYDLMK